MEAREPWEMTADEFIGPAIVGPVFEIDGRDEEYDLVWEQSEEGGLPPLWASPCGRFAVRDLGWDEGAPAVVLEADGRGVGFYIRGQSWVDPEFRGRGLATEMVLAAARLCGGSPACNPDGMGFSEAGWNLHAKAHAVSVQRALAEGKPVPPHVRYGTPPSPVGKMGEPG